MSTPAEIPTDGRIKRSERSREAIVLSMLELIAEGSLSPTAQQVAERADVGVRTVFRHFSDMETLFAAMNDRLSEQVTTLFVDAQQTGPLSQRIRAMVERRQTLFEKLSPYLRASAIQRERSEFLRAEHARGVKRLRRDLHRWLVEIEDVPPEDAAALEALLSFETYYHLRADQKLSLRKTGAVLQRSVERLLPTT